MTQITNHLDGARLSIIGVATAALMVTTFASPAHAARFVDRDWQRHEVVAHRYWHHPHYRPAPGVVYAPPVVYEPPPPPVEESPGINLIIPLHIH